MNRFHCLCVQGDIAEWTWERKTVLMKSLKNEKKNDFANLFYGRLKQNERILIGKMHV